MAITKTPLNRVQHVYWVSVHIQYPEFVYCLQLLENLNVDHLPSDETNPHVLRVGWSADDTSMQLGKFLFLSLFLMSGVLSCLALYFIRMVVKCMKMNLSRLSQVTLCS